MASATLVQDSSAGNSCPVPFVFQDHQIRTVAIDDAPWFVAKDVCAALTIPWRGDTLATVQADWKGMRSFRTPSSGKRGGGAQRLAIISEPAVYKLAFRSNKPEADAFTNWVASEVLPAIRKTGQYAATPAPSSGPLTPAQCRHLHDVLDAKVSALSKEHHRAAYAEAWTRFNRHFRIAKYAQLPQGQFSDALAYLIAMQIKTGAPALTAQKALPIATAKPSAKRPTGAEIEEMVAAVKLQGREMLRSTERLWAALWPPEVLFNDVIALPIMAALHSTSEEVFDTLTKSIRSCSRIAATISTADRVYRSQRG